MPSLSRSEREALVVPERASLGGCMKLKIVGVALLVAFAVSACGLQEQADAKFGDQHFKTVVSLVELYKLRTGSYPASLADLTFTGDWDQIAIASVHYRKLEEGYELDLVRGWVGRPDLHYPPAFWKGLGLRKSNLKHAP